MYTFKDGYRGYHQVKIVSKDELKTTFTTLWGTLCYTIKPFGLCNALRAFQHLMSKVFEPFLGLFLLVFIDNFVIYSERAFHLAKLGLVFQHLNGSTMILSPKKIIIGFLEGKIINHIVSKNEMVTYLKEFDKISRFFFPITKKAF